MARSFSRHIPPLTQPPHHSTSILWGPRGYAVGVGFSKQSLDIFLASVPSKQSIQDNYCEPSEPPRKFTCFPLCCAVSARFWPCRACRPRSWRHCGMQRPCLERLWARWKCQVDQIRLKRVLAAGPYAWNLLRSQFLPLTLPPTRRERLSLGTGVFWGALVPLMVSWLLVSRALACDFWSLEPESKWLAIWTEPLLTSAELCVFRAWQGRGLILPEHAFVPHFPSLWQAGRRAQGLAPKWSPALGPPSRFHALPLCWSDEH